MRPVDPQRLHNLETTAREIARLLDGCIQRSMHVRCGFAFLLFSFEGPEMTWVSNADRVDMVKALRELLARWEAGTADELSRPRGGD